MARVYHGFTPPKPTTNKQADGPKETKQPAKPKATKPKDAKEAGGE